jgi:RHS repeat-associated protein
MDYAPFGGELSGGTKLPDQRFAGLFRDGEAGLDYAQARSYQVRTGRFSAPDPVYAGMFDPQQWNRYSYALNAPTGYTDRSGLSPIDGFFSWPLWATVAGSLDRPAGQQASLLGFGIGGEGFYAIDSIDFSLGGADGGQTSPATPTNVTQEKVDPNVPPGTLEDLVDILTEAFQNADKR